VLLLLPSVGAFLITVETSTAGITTLQVLSVEAIGGGTSENLALPILILARRNRMMQHAITNFIGGLIVAEHIRAGERSGSALTNGGAGTSENRSLNDLTLALSAEDVGVLIRLAHSRRLNRVTLELTVAHVLLIVLQSLRVLFGLLEVDV
jgi:hypothetical protein